MVCRSLRLPRAVAALRLATFGQGTGPIWLDNVQCRGKESSLFQCRHGGLGSHNCIHREDASVVCGLSPSKFVRPLFILRLRVLFSRFRPGVVPLKILSFFKGCASEKRITFLRE